jgi:hypothetical protein
MTSLTSAFGAKLPIRDGSSLVAIEEEADLTQTDVKLKSLLTFWLHEILFEQPVAPEGFVISGTLAQLLRRESGVPPHLPDHVRLIGKSRRCGKPGPVDIALLDRLVQFGIELLGVAKALQVSLADTGP